jgi:hypothetical protein
MSDGDTEVNPAKGSKFSTYIIGLIIMGTIISCGLSVVMNKLMYGNDIIKIDKVDRTACLVIDDLEKIDYTKILLLNITPVIINSLVWIGIIMIILKKPANNANTDTNTDTEN